jgi:hypothetical protein
MSRKETDKKTKLIQDKCNNVRSRVEESNFKNDAFLKLTNQD